MSVLPPDMARRKSLAVVFADIHGYSRLMSANEESTIERVERSIGLFQSLIGDYGGTVVTVAGDGILALFESAWHALRFSVEIQREFQNDAVWSSPDEPIAFRIGINLGVVTFGKASVHGHSVNVAARLQALASPGGICVSETVRNAVRDRPELLLRPMGRQRLKNIAEPIEAFALDVTDLGTEAPARPPLFNVEPIERPDTASVAVLPLDNLSGDPRNDHLCEGISGDIITNLSRFRELLVIARHSAVLSKMLGVSARELGHRLGVLYLMTGTLQRAEGSVRIHVQLIETETGRVAWAERFDGDLSEVFSFQDEVTEIIAARLAVQISAAEGRRVWRLGLPDLQAYGLVLRGQHLSLQFTRTGNLHARRLFEHATDIDPGYGRSYAAMSRTFNLEWRYAWTDSPDTSLDRAVDLAAAAVNHDHLDARGYSELGYAHLYKKDHQASLAAYRRAIELNPNDADILAEFADALVYDGDPERAIGLLEKAMRLNPFYPDWYLWYLADAYNALGRSEDVIATVEKMQNPAEGRRLLAANYAHLGMLVEAEAHAREVIRLHPQFTISGWAQRPPYKDNAILERYVDGLRKAGLPEK